MDQKLKLEQLKFLSETHRNLHEQRRRVELRVLTIILSMYGLATFAVLKGDIDKEFIDDAKFWIWFAFLAIGGISSGYLRAIHKANRCNIRIAEAAEDEISGLDSVDSKLKCNGSPCEALGWCSVVESFSRSIVERLDDLVQVGLVECV